MTDREEFIERSAKDMRDIVAILKMPGVDLEQVSLVGGVIHQLGIECATLAHASPDDTVLYEVGQNLITLLEAAMSKANDLARIERGDASIH
jgi:hypothetical protein